MPDTPVAEFPPPPYDPRLELRVSRLEDDVRDLKSAQSRLETMVTDVRESVTRIEATLNATLPHLATKAEMAEILKTLPHVATKAEMTEIQNTLPHLATKAEMTEILKTLPHLATKEELADKPGKAFLVSLAAIVLAAYGAGLAALSLLK